MSAQIFGRDAELRTIGALIGDLPRSPGALVLTGPAGAGKTTLLRAGAALAAEHAYTVLATTPAHSDLRLAFAGLSDLLERSLGTVIDEIPPPQARALRVALALADAPPQPPDPRVIAAAFRTAVSLLARSATVLLVIDDVQWLDAPSAAAIGFAVRRLDREPVGLLCAQRTAGQGDELPLELSRARLRADLLPVSGLSLGALHRLLLAELGTSFSHPTLRRIEAESAGNPFIALEIGRALARGGITNLGNRPLPVPGTLSGLVGRRLGELSPAVLDALHLVAVMADATVEQYLAAGSGGAELDAAVLAGVLDQDGGRLRFSHPLLASAVAGSIPPARRRMLHEIAARLVQRPEEQARHRALASTGPSAQVAADLDQAARAADARGAPATAAELFGLAASLTPHDQQADRCRRTLDATRRLALAGETRAAMAALDELIGSIPAGLDRAAALSQLAALRQDDSAAEATDLLEQALAEAGDDPAQTAEIHFTLGDSWSKRGDQARALAESRLALADAERGGDTALLAATMAQVVLRTFSCGGGIDERLLGRALELEREVEVRLLFHADPPSWVAGWCHLAEGRLEEAESELQQVLDWCDSEGIESSRGDVLLRLSVIASQSGDNRRAAELASQGLVTAEQMDLPQLVSALLYACGQAALNLGQTEAVRDLATRGMEAARVAGELPFLLRNEGLLGSLDLALGSYRSAAQRLGPLACQWRKMGVRLFNPTSIEPEAVEALIGAGELDPADVILTNLEHGVHNAMTAAVIAHGRGKLAAARGDLAAAVTELTESLRLQDQCSPQLLERGRALLLLGAIQRRLKQRSVARATLSEAVGIFDRIGAVLWAARARTELARVSGRALGTHELTVTELRVAELVARGMSNKEVAAELFVTVRAVESTLTKAFAKLGVRSRTGLAARLRQVD